MAMEFSELGVRVNCVNPGFTGTEMVAAIQPHFFEKAAGILARTLVKEPLTTGDIANSVLFLSSPLSAHTTGESLLIDSGIRAN